MRKIRRGVFETNSSSVHTLTICTEEEFRKFEDGETVKCNWNHLLKGTEWEGKEFIPVNAAKEIEREYLKRNGMECDDDAVGDGFYDDFITYNREMNDEYLETYEEHFTTPSGDKMVAFGRYGYDG